jgi:NAD(P)H-flavin reductase
MLRFISEEEPLRPRTRIVWHSLIKSRDQALFLDTLLKLKKHFGDSFDPHIWITRYESHVPSPPYFSNAFQVHRLEASSRGQFGQPWAWWSHFASSALEDLDTKEKREKSLVYICGPQGLTDKLVNLYKETGMSTEDGHVQVEKWW